MNLSTPVHRAAGRDDAADHRHRAGRRCSPSRSCRWRRCRRSISRPSRCSAQMPGASPETMAHDRRRAAGAPSRARSPTSTEMTSQSSVGTTRITLQFGLDRDIDGAARDVQAAINAARADLPTSLRSNPTYRKVNPADAPIMILALTSKTLTPGPALRRRRDRAAAEAVAAARRRRGRRERQRAAGGARRAQSRRAVQIRHRAGGRARRPGLGQRQRAEGRDRGRPTALPDLHQRPGEPRRPTTSRWSSPTATARRCS